MIYIFSSKILKEYKLKPNEDIETAKSHALTLEKFINPLLVQYLDSYHDKDIKSFYIILDTYEVNLIPYSLAVSGSGSNRIL